HLVHQLLHRLQRSARRRAARRAVSEPLDDPRDPLAVEVFTRDDDDALTTEIEGGREDAAVPEGHHRLTPCGANRVDMLETFGAPPQRVSERVDDRVAEAGDQ